MGSHPLGADPAPSQSVQAVLSVLCCSHLELKRCNFQVADTLQENRGLSQAFWAAPRAVWERTGPWGLSSGAPALCCAAALRLARWDLNGVLRDIPPTGTEPEPGELGSFRKEFAQHVHLTRLVYNIIPFLCKLVVLRVQSLSCSPQAFVLSSLTHCHQKNMKILILPVFCLLLLACGVFFRLKYL